MNQLQRLKILIPDEQNDELLRRGEDAIKEKRRSPPDLPLEKKYKTLQIEIAIFLFNKLGVEGEKAHKENSVLRIYENAHFPDSMLNMVVPLGVVLK